MIGGLTGAAGLSQLPEFSQQYLQRLAGQVDELTRQVVEFDQTALADEGWLSELRASIADSATASAATPPRRTREAATPAKTPNEAAAFFESLLK